MVDPFRRDWSCSQVVTRRKAGWLLLALLVFVPAVPAPAEEPAPLIMGVFPRRSPSSTAESFTPLAKYLSRELGRPVRIETAPDFSAFWQMVEARRYHIVHYNQYHYVRSHRQLGYRLVAKNEEGRKSAIGGAILVRKDSGIRSLHDLRGKTIVFGGNRHAMNSYNTPTHLLRRAGLRHGDYQEEFAVNPPNVALAVFFRRAVAGGIGDIVFTHPFVRDKVDVTQLEVIAKSAPVAHLPWAVRGDLPSELRERIRRALTSVKKAPDGPLILKAAALTDIVPAEDREFDYVREIVRDEMRELY